MSKKFVETKQLRLVKSPQNPHLEITIGGPAVSYSITHISLRSYNLSHDARVRTKWTATRQNHKNSKTLLLVVVLYNTSICHCN